MKCLFIFFALLTATIQGQSVLKFDKRFVESEDKWVAFQKGKDSTFTYGFIYIDAQAGLTLNYEGNFTYQMMEHSFLKKWTVQILK